MSFNFWEDALKNESTAVFLLKRKTKQCTNIVFSDVLLEDTFRSLLFICFATTKNKVKGPKWKTTDWIKKPLI